MLGLQNLLCVPTLIIHKKLRWGFPLVGTSPSVMGYPVGYTIPALVRAIQSALAGPVNSSPGAISIAGFGILPSEKRVPGVLPRKGF